MEITKIVGWLVFSFGILIILLTLRSSYYIFTGEVPPPEIFVFESKAPKEVSSKGQGGLEEQFREIVSQQLKEVLPVEALSDTLFKSLNLLVWSLGAGIFIFGGAQIAGLGIKLIKK